MYLKSCFITIFIAILFGCSDVTRESARKFESGGGGCSGEPPEEGENVYYTPSPEPTNFPVPIPSPTDLDNDALNDILNNPNLTPTSLGETLGLNRDPEISFYSDWKGVDEMPGVSYRISCKYSGKYVGGLYEPDVRFHVWAKNSNSNKYVLSDALFGVPENKLESNLFKSYGWPLKVDEDWILRYGHTSSSVSARDQCKKSYTGVVGFKYTNENGISTGEPMVTKEFNSTNLGLKSNDTVISSPAPITSSVDTTPPTADFLFVNNDATRICYPKSTASLFFRGTDNVGITHYYVGLCSTEKGSIYCFDGSGDSINPKSPSASISGWKSVGTPRKMVMSYKSYTIFSAGQIPYLGESIFTFNIWFKDKAGNVSLPAYDNITYLRGIGPPICN